MIAKQTQQKRLFFLNKYPYIMSVVLFKNTALYFIFSNAEYVKKEVRYHTLYRKHFRIFKQLHDKKNPNDSCFFVVCDCQSEKNQNKEDNNINISIRHTARPKQFIFRSIFVRSWFAYGSNQNWILYLIFEIHIDKT